jgi:antirestriction protein ArdC
MLFRPDLDDVPAGQGIGRAREVGKAWFTRGVCVEKNETDDAGQEVEHEIPFLKAYTVFNVEQIAELPEHFYQMKQQPKEQMQRIEQADRFFANTNATIRTGGKGLDG